MRKKRKKRRKDRNEVEGKEHEKENKNKKNVHEITNFCFCFGAWREFEPYPEVLSVLLKA